MPTTRSIMTARKDGQPGSEYRDFVIAESLHCADARLYTVFHDDPVQIPADSIACWLRWRDAAGTEHKDLITAAKFSPSGGWNTSLDAAAVAFLRHRDVLVRGWNA
jgi:hypothetical protein